MRATLVALLLLVPALAWAEPDEDLLGKAQGYPIGTNNTWYWNPNRVGAWSALDRVPGLRFRHVAPATEPLALPRMANPPAIAWRYRETPYTLADYLERQRTTGLLILKDGQIVAEHYRYGRKDDARFLSFSMAKSVTSLLVGVAHAKGAIASLDDPAERYAKELAGSGYGGTPIRHLLRMSSGLAFAERYDGLDDVAEMVRSFERGGTTRVLRGIAERLAPSGSRFAYASSETDVLGRVLKGATGRSVAELTQEWLWQPMGAEHPASWRIGADGQEATWAYFNASLRDWGRLGLLLARDGRVGERQVVPRDYLLDATDAQRQPEAFQPRRATPNLGYGYQFWLLPTKERTFLLQGVHGQAVYVQPASGIVLVLTSVWEQASGRQDPAPYQERTALWRGVLRSLGGSTD